MTPGQPPIWRLIVPCDDVLHVHKPDIVFFSIRPLTNSLFLSSITQLSIQLSNSPYSESYSINLQFLQSIDCLCLCLFALLLLHLTCLCISVTSTSLLTSCYLLPRTTPQALKSGIGVIYFCKSRASWSSSFAWAIYNTSCLYISRIFFQEKHDMILLWSDLRILVWCHEMWH